MSGATNRNDDQDFSDDFILEDSPASEPEAASGAPRPDDPSSLESLFDEHPEASVGDAPRPVADASVAPAEDDMLFVDQSAGVQPSEEFERRQQFDEGSAASWQGRHLAPDEIGIPVDSDADAAELADGSPAEDEFAVDSEQELQLVEDDRDLDADPGTAQLAETFILDEGAGEWTASGNADADPAVSTDEFAPATPGDEGAEATAQPADVDDGVAVPVEAGAAGAGAGAPADGWEPLPGAAADFEAEAQGAEPSPATDEQPATDGAGEEPALVGGQGSDPDDSPYLEDAATLVVGGPRPRRVQFLRIFASMAAAVLVMGAGAAVVLRPEWFGLHVQPQLVERVAVARPEVDVAVPPPAMPTAVETRDPGVQTTPAEPGGQSSGGAAEPGPDPATAPVEPGGAGDPGAGDPTPTPPSPATAGGAAGDPTEPVVVPPAPVEPVPPEPAGSGSASGGQDVATTAPITGPESIPAPAPEAMLPAGKDLLVGEVVPEPTAEVGPVLTVAPGSKAFAQLRNGNFFIGSVKVVGRDAITMRVDGGEVTLATAQITRVTPLDSQEFQALKESTSGFLRLSNKNRLVGTILKGLADDHYVLEMRSNRLMVPKDQIEAIGGGATGDVTVGTGADDEDWLRQVAARLLQDPAARAPKPK